MQISVGNISNKVSIIQIILYRLNRPVIPAEPRDSNLGWCQCKSVGIFCMDATGRYPLVCKSKKLYAIENVELDSLNIVGKFWFNPNLAQINFTQLLNSNGVSPT